MRFSPMKTLGFVIPTQPCSLAGFRTRSAEPLGDLEGLKKSRNSVPRHLRMKHANLRTFSTSHTQSRV
jgi:hypothetical protein